MFQLIRTAVLFLCLLPVPDLTHTINLTGRLSRVVPVFLLPQFLPVLRFATISTPHQGSEPINVLNRLPDRLYRRIASWLDRSISRFGDRNPDCYHAGKQLSPAFCAQFNEETPDRAEVYYRRYLRHETFLE